jgi:nitroreductase
MSADTDVFEIMGTMRAMRRLKPDPVPDALIAKILEAGASAPNGGNSQTWRFLVVKDLAIKQAVQVQYKRAYDDWIGPRYSSTKPPPGATKEKYSRQHTAVDISPTISTKRLPGSSPASITAKSSPPATLAH